jgi:paraquat-inducible protein B
MVKPVKQRIESLKSGWYVWLFPVIALAICGWLLTDYLKQRGPIIRILFDDASSIQAEKTKVRYRGVTIGTVTSIELTEDAKEVVVYVRLQKDAEQFASEGAKFWVVVPKVNFSGISGLDTLFAGSYITALPGKADGELKEDFKGQVGGDLNESEVSMATYYVETANAESMGAGDAITFRGVNVGTVAKVNFTKTAQLVNIQLHIQSKYTHLIRTNTIFWRKVGIQAKLGLFNSEVKVNSIDSILHGGIELFTPEPPGEIAKPHTKFNLVVAPPKGYEKWNPILE